MFILALLDAFLQFDSQYDSTKNFIALSVSELKLLNLLSQIMIRNTNSHTTVRILNPKTNIHINTNKTENTHIW